MEQADQGAREIRELRERLARLTEASVRINESLDVETVLQGVLDSARSLTGARYSLITTLDQAGQVDDFLVSGLSAEESRQLWELPEGLRFFEYLSSLPGPLRVGDFAGHVRSLRLPEFRLPVPVSSFLAAPIRHRGEGVGNIYVAKSAPGRGFSGEDEETLVMFASQAALVIANARRHGEEQRARAGLETLVDTSPVGVVVFDARTGLPLSINRETRRILGDLRTPGGEVEQLLEILTFRRADGREISLEEFPLAQALSTGETVRAEEIVVEVPDGRSVTTLINATPIRPEEGEVESVIVTLQDLTPLEEMERLRAGFLAMVSHELQAPLASIRGSTTTLLHDEPDLDPAERRQYHRIIEQAAGRMRSLISDLLDVARIETGTLAVAPGPAEVRSLVDEARNAFLTGGGRHDLRIEWPQDLPLVMADRRQIVQVLGNLLSNAARHSPPSSAIRVTAVREEVHVAVSVADDGVGVSAERLPQLFRKFPGLDPAGQEGETGLGLAICKGIVEAHGGRIWAESEGVGLGSRFTFTIPAVDETVTRAGSAPLASLAQQPEDEPKRILALDDDPEALRYVRDALTRAGYAPIVTADPAEVSRLVEEERPHLALLDLDLPGASGIELMRGILEKAGVPVIFLAAYGQDDAVARAFEQGASDYLVKPFSPTELATRIRAALRRGELPEAVEPSEPYVLGGLAIDYAEREVRVAGRALELTPNEYGVLVELSIYAGRVLPHGHLLRRVWGPRNSGDAGLVRTIVKRLRRKLGDDATTPAYIFTEPRVGYRLAKPDPPAETEA